MAKLLSIILVFQLVIGQLLPMVGMAEELPPEENLLLHAENIERDTSFGESQEGEKELTDYRTKYSKRYYLGNGMFREEIYHKPIHYKSQGKWKEKKTKFVDDAGSLRNKENEFEISFKKNFSNGFLHIGKGSEKIMFRPLFIHKPTKGEVRDNIVTYSEIAPEADLQYISTSTGIKEILLLKGPSAPNVFPFEFKVKGLEYRENEKGHLEFYRASDEEDVLFVLDKPVIIDTVTNRNVVTFEIEEKQNNSFLYTITVDEDWLRSPEREFPILLDPTINTSDNNDTIDTFVSSAYPTSSYDYWSHFYVGKGDTLGQTRALMNFVLPALPSGASIYQADLVLNNTTVYSQHQTPTLEAYRITSDWLNSPVTWSNQPTVTGPQHSYQLTNLSASTITMPVTNIVKDWYNGADNYGLELRYQNEHDLIREFLSTDASGNTEGVPYLSITYTVDGLGSQPFWTYDGPVNMANRNLLLSFTDAEYPGKGVELNVQRTFNSRSTSTGVFGYGWSSPFDIKLYAPKYGPAKLIDGTGTVHYFKYNPDGTYESTDGLYWDLYFTSQTKAEVRTTDGTIYEFDLTTNQLTQIKDAKDSKIIFHYQNGQLTSISDGKGLSLTFTYENGYLKTVTDPANRTWTYHYAGDQLTSVVQPDGATTKYGYNSSNNLIWQKSPAGRMTYYFYTSDDRLAIISPTNAVPNPNFEVDSDGNGTADHFSFGNGYNAPLVSDTSESFYNQTSVSLSADSLNPNNYTYYLSAPIYLDFTESYTLSGYVKATQNSGTYKSVLSILAYDSSNQYLGELGRMEVIGTQDWKRVEKEITSFPAGTEKVYVKIGVSETNGSGTSWFDGIQLEKGTVSPFIAGDQYTGSLSAKKSAVYDGEGRKVLYSYNDHQNILSQQLDPAGKNITTTFVWDSIIPHYLKSVTDPNGSSWHYQMDTNTGNVIEVTDPNGHKSGYSWDGNSNLTEYRDITNEKYRMTYDDESNQWTARDPYDRASAVEYDAYDNLSLTSPTLGLADNLVVNTNFESTFDSSGLPNGWSYSGGQVGYVTRSAESQYGLYSMSMTNSSSHTYPYTILVSDPISINVNEDYVLSGYVKSSQTSGDQETILSVLASTSSGTVELGRLQINGNEEWQEVKTVIQKTEIPADTTSVQVKIASKNTSGTGTSYVDGVKFQTYPVDTSFNLVDNSSFERDQDGNGWPDGWTTPSGTYSIVSGEGEYFSGSKAIKISNATVFQAVRPNEYIPYDKQKGESFHLTAFVKTENLVQNGSHIKFEMYDANKNIIKSVASEKVGGNTPWRKLTVEIGPEDIPENTAYIRPGLMPDTSSGTTYFDNVRLQYGKWNTTYTFDTSKTWLKTITDPYGNTRSFTYTTTEYPENIGVPRLYVDEKNNQKTIEYVPGTSLEKKIISKNGSLVWEYDYNEDGDVTAFRSIEDGFVKAQTKVTYTKSGWLDSFIDVIGQDDETSTETDDRVTTVSYTPAGLIDTMTKPNGDTISYEYNELGEVTDVSINGEKKYSYQYDHNGNVKVVEDLSRNVTWNATYNNLNLLTDWTSSKASFNYQRNSKGQITQRTFTAGTFTKTETTTYNRIGQPKTFRDGNGETTEILYSDQGQLTWMRVGTMFEMLYDYQENGRFKTYTTRWFHGDIIEQERYQYDSTKKLITDIIHHNGETYRYEYDNYGQLTKEIAPDGSSIEYAYTKEGLRKQKIVRDASGTVVESVDYQYGEAHQLTSVGNDQWDYTENGQVSYDGQFRYLWDAEGNLAEIWNQDQTVKLAEYTYDDLGRRVSQIINGEETTFIYNGNSRELVAELDASGHVTKYYTWSPTGHLLSITTGGATYYPVRNGHGDITKILDAQGNIVATYTYDAFGNLVESTGQTDLSPYRYAGYRYDEVSGLYYLQARYYHPESGQFLSLDPASELPDYTYAANSPVTYIDPSGNFILDATAIAIDLNNFIKEPTWANFGWLASNAISLFIPGNISLTAKAVKSVQSLSHTADATRTIGKTDEIASGAKKVKSSTPKSKSPSAKSNKTTKGCNCFTAGTKVLTDQGEKPIEDVEVGDNVLAKDENNPDGELTYKEVTGLYRNLRDDIIKLHIGKQIIETTDNHPFWVEGKGWTFADELEAGDKLQQTDGSRLMIDKVEFVKLDEPVIVYNFTVEDYHTYYVTDLGVWVHNTECSSEGKSNFGKLISVEKGKWKSTAGLIYGQGSIHGNRVRHVLAHGNPNPNKPLHTVFNVSNKKILGLIDEAWSKKDTVRSFIQENGSEVYDIPMGRTVGTRGETRIRIVVERGTSNIITAFPRR